MHPIQYFYSLQFQECLPISGSGAWRLPLRGSGSTALPWRWEPLSGARWAHSLKKNYLPLCSCCLILVCSSQLDFTFFHFPFQWASQSQIASSFAWFSPTISLYHNPWLLSYNFKKFESGTYDRARNLLNIRAWSDREESVLLWQ